MWLAVGLLLAGLLARDGLFLALSIPLLIYLSAGLWFSPETLHLEVAGSLDLEQANPGQPVTLHLKVTNPGGSAEEAVIRQPLPHGLQLVEGQAELAAALPPGAAVEMQMVIHGKRGLYRFPEVEVTLRETSDLFRLQQKFSTGMKLLVLPEVIRLTRLSIRPRQTRPYPGPVLSRKGGSGTDFFGVREYQMGDSRKWLNWRATARSAENMFTNEFEREQISDVGLILDARMTVDLVNGNDALFEYSVRAAASLADAFLRDGNRVGLLVYGYGLEQTFYGYGKVQRARILTALAQARSGLNYSLENLRYIPPRLFPAHSQLVVITPLVQSDVNNLIRFRALGYEVLVVSPDPVEFQALALAGQPNLELALRIARAERWHLIRRLRRAGVRILNWPVHQPFDRVALTLERGGGGQWTRSHLEDPRRAAR
jgi:uncharacterized protein (DUF58 family)